MLGKSVCSDLSYFLYFLGTWYKEVGGTFTALVVSQKYRFSGYLPQAKRLATLLEKLYLVLFQAFRSV